MHSRTAEKPAQKEHDLDFAIFVTVALWNVQNMRMVAQVSHWVPESSLHRSLLGKKKVFLIRQCPYLLFCKAQVSIIILNSHSQRSRCCCPELVIIKGGTRLRLLVAASASIILFTPSQVDGRF